MPFPFRRLPSLLPALIPAFLAALPGRAVAQTSRYWDGNGNTAGAGTTPSGTWGSSAFWGGRSDGTSTPTTATTAASDTLYFSAGTDATGAYTVSVSSTRNAGQINIQEGTPTFSSGTISLGLGASSPGIVVAAGAGNPTFSSNLTITGTQTFNVGSGRTLTLSGGTFTRTAGAVLTVTGAGNVTSTKTNLSANNSAGIAGTWVTVGTGASARYATFSGSTLTALTGTAAATAADLTDTTGLVNYDLASLSGTVADTVSTNTIRNTGSAGTLTLGGTSFSTNGLLHAGSGVWTIDSGALTIGADKELLVQGTNGVKISSVIQDNAGGASGLTKAGSNTLTLTGANTYTGTTAVTAGTLQVGDGTTNGTLAGPIAVQTGAALTFTTVGDQTYGGAISGAGTVTKNGAGTLTLSGSSSAAITLSAGNLVYTASSTGTTTISTGTLSLAASSSASLGKISVGATSGSTGVVNITSGTYTQSGGFYVGDNATATGTVNHSGGALTLGGGAELLLGQAGPGTYNLSGGTLTTASSSSYGILIGVNSNITATFNLSGTGTLDASNALLLVGRANYGAANTTVTYNQTGGTATAGTLVIGGQSQGSGGPATSNVNATMSVTGGTFSATTFSLLATGNSDTAALTIGGTAQVTLPDFPTARGTGTTTSITFDTTSGGGGYLAPAASSASFLPAGTFNNAYLTANGAAINTNGFDITVGQVLSDKITLGTLTKSGAGTLTLAGANTFSGATTVAAGTLSLTNNLALQNSALNTAGAGSVALTTTTPTFGGLQGSTALATAISSGYGSVTALTLNPGTGLSHVYSGTIADGAAGMTLTKTGAGTQTLSGTQTYTGATTISAGTLAINGSLANSAVTVASGGTLGGTGTLGAAATVASGGTLAPGNSPGLLTFGNGLTLAGGSTTIFEINGIARGTTHDAINVTGGTLTYGGTFTLSFGSTVPSGTTLHLIDTMGATVGASNFAYVTATGSYSGAFADNGGNWTYSNGTQWLTFVTSTGDLFVSAIPEPSTYAAICGVLALGFVVYRRRMRVG